METLTNLPDVLLMEILARLSMRCISRFKLVCKTWKTTLESLYFRRRFLSLHQNSSCSWSLVHGKFMEKELVGSYGCQTWNLPKSPICYLPKSCNICRRDYNAYPCSSNGLIVLQRADDYVFFVGNPVIQKWVEIPKPPHESLMFGLVSRVDMDGVVLSFKLVLLEVNYHCPSTYLNVDIYSSETGIWIEKQLQCHIHYSFKCYPISVNERLYLLSETMLKCTEPGVLISHDFYSETDQCQNISLPDQYKNTKNEYLKGDLSTSGGFLMYMDILSTNSDEKLKIWKLNNDSAWQLLWEINLTSVGYYCDPMAIHPFDSDIVYLFSYRRPIMITYNQRTQNYTTLREASWYSDDDHHQDSCIEYSRFTLCRAIFLCQFVLPRWI